MGPSEPYPFRSTLWRWEGPGAWHFLTLPKRLSKSIAATGEPSEVGSVRVQVTIGRTTWQTSVFPDNKRGAFLLPVKAAVRKAEHLVVGDRPLVTLIVCHAIGG